MIKLIDIAKELNIAPSTVSKALNNKGRISPELKEKIVQTAERMNYHPNEHARGLRTNQSTMIGVILPDISNIFYGKLLKGIDNTARENGYSVLYCDSGENLQTERSYFDILDTRNICGMIIAPAGISGIYSQISPDRNIVFVDSMPERRTAFPVVSIDNYQASYELTQHLIRTGYRDIRMICGQASDTVTEDRIHGFRDCCRANGLPGNPEVAIGKHSFEGGKSMMAKMLTGKKPEAVITENNFLAYGALSVIRNSNLKVPGDIALACFDGNDDFDTMFINLTTVIQPIEEIGRRAAECIIRKNEGQTAPDEPKRVLVDYTLHIGDSA